MIAALHVLLGIITPHLGAIFTGIFSLLKARQAAKAASGKEEEEVDEDEMKTQLAEFQACAQIPNLC